MVQLEFGNEALLAKCYAATVNKAATKTQAAKVCANAILFSIATR